MNRHSGSSTNRWRRLLRISLAIMSCLAGSNAANADDWPAWRGLRGDGISAEKELPRKWSPDESIEWKTAIPGVGHSSPIIFGKSVFLLSADRDQQARLLVHLDRESGKIRWTKTVLTAPFESIHALNSHASSTPATDGKLVFVSFLDVKEMFLAAYDFAGNKIWEVRPGPFSSKHGYCANPVLYKDSLFINGDHDGEAFIARLRKSDGSIIWKTPRPRKTRSYCTPIIVDVAGQDQLMLNGSYCTAGFDVETGKQIWIADGPSEQMVATLVHNQDLIFSLGGFPERHLLALRKGGVGDITKSHLVWRTHKAIPYVPSPLLYGDWLHVVSDEGIYTCFEPATGKVMQTKRSLGHTSSSIVGGDNMIYITADTGRTLVLKNSPDFEVISECAIGEDCYSTPAIADHHLFIRGVQHLFAIKKSTP